MIKPLTRIRHAHIRHILQRYPIPHDLWHAVSRDAEVLHRLDAVEMVRLRELSTLLVHEKRYNGAGGLQVDDAMRVTVAAQASLAILKLGIDYYRDWIEIVLYPAGFRVAREWTGAGGVVHTENQALSGESWSRGPLVLSWTDVERDLRGDRPGSNVVIHEFAHKLDALNGATNGMPPLHANMVIPEWTAAMSTAFSKLQAELAKGGQTSIDGYAATNPAEFFAVASEVFFSAPARLRHGFADVYDQFVPFYRQNPLQSL